MTTLTLHIEDGAVVLTLADDAGTVLRRPLTRTQALDLRAHLTTAVVVGIPAAERWRC